MSEQSREPEVTPVVSHAEAQDAQSSDSAGSKKAAGGGGRLFVILGAVAVVLVAAVAGGVWWYMQSPQYALSRLADSAKAGDWEAVQEGYDATSVAREAAAAAIDETFSVAKSQQQLQGLRSQVDKIARPALIRDTLSATESGLAAEPDFKSPLIQSVPRLAAQPVSIVASSQTATVTLGDKSKPKGEKNLVLLMKKVDGNWRVVSWANARGTLKTAGGSWLAKYEESPEYVLTRVAIASNDGDWDAFTKYVDVDTMVEGLVDAAISKATTPSPPSGSHSCKA